MYCAANEYILVINLHTGNVEKKFSCLNMKFEVTCLCLTEDCFSLAVGYHNGAITIVNLKDISNEKKFFLHKSEITTLKFFKNVHKINKFLRI